MSITFDDAQVAEFFAPAPKAGYEQAVSAGPEVTDQQRSIDPASGVNTAIGRAVSRHREGDGQEVVNAKELHDFASTMSAAPSNQIGGEMSDDMKRAMQQIKHAQRESGHDLLRALQFQQGDIEAHHLGTLNAATISNNIGGRSEPDLPGH